MRLKKTNKIENKNHDTEEMNGEKRIELIESFIYIYIFRNSVQLCDSCTQLVTLPQYFFIESTYFTVCYAVQLLAS